MANKTYLAVDLGAGSGRVMAARYNGKSIALEEVARWNSAPVKVGDSFHWDAPAIFNDIVCGVRKARSLYGDEIVSLGIDTWGVDYGLLGGDGKLLNLPYIYRDARTGGMMEKVFEKVPKDEIYALTGIQFMFFNTLYQLMAELEGGGNIDKAKDFLMMPDLFAYMFTGEKFNERTNASTTQFYNPFKRDWDFSILDRIGVGRGMFNNGFAECGTVIGKVLPELRSDIGGLNVVAVASHDTASAVAATPTLEEVPAYINSGTWCLPGLELSEPIATPEAFKENFTNEVGVGGTIRFLKNVTGMWLVQKCKEAWQREGRDMSYSELEEAAARAEPGRTIFDTDAPDFVMPDDMPKAIENYCSSHSIPVPRNQGEMFRSIQESIADKYAKVFKRLERLSGKKVSQINVMGGGSRDAMLNRLTQEATGCKVVAGPVESTAYGNALVQMMASGDISSLREGRSILADNRAD